MKRRTEDPPQKKKKKNTCGNKVSAACEVSCRKTSGDKKRTN